MKPIVNEDEEWQGECKKNRKHRHLSEEMTSNEVEEGDGDEGRNICFLISKHARMMVSISHTF